MKLFKHKIIGDDYLHRWHIIPRNRFFNIYLHKFVGSDKRGELHDHPWWFVSVLLKGRLMETELSNGVYSTHLLPLFRPRWYSHAHTHRLDLLGTMPAWTIVITGPRLYLWGFFNNKKRTTVMNADDFSPRERDELNFDEVYVIDSWEPDYETKCTCCGNSPTVVGVKNGEPSFPTNMCGPCCFGDSDCADPEKW